MVVAKKWILAKKFDGVPTEHDILLKEETLPTLNTGDVLFETVYLSLDPYTKLCGLKWTDTEDYIKKLTDPMHGKLIPKEYITMLLGTKLGETIPGEQLVKVLQTKNTKYPVGKMFLTKLGWRTHTVINPDKYLELIKPLPLIDDLPHSLALSVLGLPGATAYLGLLKKAELKKGQTVLITAPTDGTIGTIAAQITHLLGCTVVVCTDSDEKVTWLKQIGITHAINMKEHFVDDTLKKLIPTGFDVLLDCAGGELSGKLLHHHMKRFGRIIVTENILTDLLTTTTPATGHHVYLDIMLKELTIKGMFSTLHLDDTEMNEATTHLKKWIKEGKLVYKEHIGEGFDITLTTFKAMLEGHTVGKTLIKI